MGRVAMLNPSRGITGSVPQTPSLAPTPVSRLRVAAPSLASTETRPTAVLVPSTLNPTSNPVFTSDFALVIPWVVLPDPPLNMASSPPALVSSLIE